MATITHAPQHHTPSPKERARFRSMKPGFSGPGPRCCKMFNQKQMVQWFQSVQPLVQQATAHPRLHLSQPLVTGECGPFRQHMTADETHTVQIIFGHLRQPITVVHRDSHLESRSQSSCIHGTRTMKWWFQHFRQGQLVTTVNYSHYEPVVGICIFRSYFLVRPQLHPSKSQNFEATRWTGLWATHLLLPFPFPPRRGTDCSVSGSARAFALALAFEAGEALGIAFAFGKGIDFALDSIVKENWDLAPGFQLNMCYFSWFRRPMAMGILVMFTTQDQPKERPYPTEMLYPSKWIILDPPNAQKCKGTKIMG